MKRILMGLISLFCVMIALAQTHDVRGEVFDRKHEPIVGALVRVAGTDLNTVTDMDGNFLLRDVPKEAEILIIESIGMETRKVKLNEPIQMTPRRKKLSFVAKAGINMSKYTMTGSDYKMGYEFGLGIEVRMSKHWAFQTGVDFCSRGARYEASFNNSIYKEVWNPVMLDLPIRFLVRWRLARNTNLVASFGPLLSCGMGGKAKVSETGRADQEYDIFSGNYKRPWGKEAYALLDRFNFGAVYGMGIEYKKWLVGVTGKNIALIADDGYSFFGYVVDHNVALTFGVSYRF